MLEIWQAQERVVSSVFSELGFKVRVVEKDLREQRIEYWRVIIDDFDPFHVAPEYKEIIKGPDESQRKRYPMEGKSINVCLARKEEEWYFLVNKSDINQIGVILDTESHFGQWRIKMFTKHGLDALDIMRQTIEDRISYEHEMKMRDPNIHPLLKSYGEILREEYHPPRMPWERPDYITREEYLAMIGR
jgi:hypothetical protein